MAWRQALKFADNENIASILLKIELLGAREVAIVVQPHLKVFRNPVAMRLLQRKAEDLGIAVALISDDEMTRQLCAEAGFANYSTIEEFQRDATWRDFYDRPPEPARRPLATWVSAIAGLVLLGVIGWVGYFVLPAATILVTPSVESLTMDVRVVADESANGVDVEAGKIPAHLVTAEVAGQTTVNASGLRDAADQSAKGTVTFTNQTTDAVTVPRSTIVSAGSHVYYTVQDTTVSPSIQIGDTLIPGTGSAAVQAVDAGEQANVPIGAITAVQGPLSSKLTVINQVPISGGTVKKVSYLSADDQSKAKQALLDRLTGQAMDKINEQIARNETFILSPAAQGDRAIEELTYEESPEQVTTRTTLHMKVLVKGLTFLGDDVNAVIEQTMETAAARQGGGAELRNEPLTINPPAIVSNDGSAVTLQVRSSGAVSVPLRLSAFSDEVRGLDPEKASGLIRQSPGVAAAEVKLWPGWVHRVPSFSWRISTKVAGPPPTA